MIKKIIIVAGDPNGINSEIIFKSWKRLDKNLKKNTYLVANFKLIKEQLKKLKLRLQIVKVDNIKENISSNNLKILDIPLKFKNPFKVSENSSSKYVLKSLDFAHKLAITGKINGFINCPISKKLLSTSNNIGVTEYLASKCNIYDKSEVMLIYNKKLSVSPLTTHIKIAKITKNLTRQLIIKKVFSLNKSFTKIFKKKPKIGILGLNPHNGEMKKNTEEVTKIIPAIKFLKKKGISISGPLVCDTTFIDSYKNYNVLVGMYHDQVLTPFKTLFHYDAINITLGLDYLRVSPDHGPAYDIVGKNKANSSSLQNCIQFIHKINK